MFVNSKTPNRSVVACPLPESSLLNKYAHPASGAMQSYTDCYAVEVCGPAVLQELVFAFYTTPLFKAERLILRWFAAKPSTDEQARQLAQGEADSFAAWSVEERTGEQLLMRDFRGRTRSWFMVTPQEHRGRPTTILRFGSAVVAKREASTGESKLGTLFAALLGFHRLYSRMLLYSAMARMEKLRG